MKNMCGSIALTSAFVAFLGAMPAAAETSGNLTLAMPSSNDNPQGMPGDSTLAPDVGLGAPVTELNLSRFRAGSQRPGDPGLAVGARYMYQATQRLSVGGQISHLNFGDRDFAVPGLAGTIGSSLLTFQGLARYWLTPASTVNPYVIGGVGLGYFAAHLRETGDPSEVLLDSDSLGLALSGGGGVEGRFGKDKSLLAGAELLWGLTTIDSSKFGSNIVSAMGLTGRVGYRF